MIVVGDTSGIIEAFAKGAESESCRVVLNDASLVVVSPLVLAEVDHLAKARFGSKARDKVLAFIFDQVDRMRFTLADVTNHIKSARRVNDAYRGLDLDMADAFTVCLAAEYQTEAILTLDRRDFRALRPLTQEHTHFRLLPDDMV
ncbi:VapC toxin family PIN domain ribonuclease [Nocardia nova]|uniref:VapC toxin family PIN domain ribonuclease n=1 Tax=Nocardia nova TaxID=37330 RepID=A0A2S6ANZ3_9NOCA|nr:PIN domain-containing protein [Nocardia nova]PPJ28935.1 VapC toxin family PIN domain ribonuclease [Nocardia nova]PPJ36948.1 VapC toxin family PIN domain ribonuclease [Nocardia nova]